MKENLWRFERLSKGCSLVTSFPKGMRGGKHDKLYIVFEKSISFEAEGNKKFKKL